MMPQYKNEENKRINHENISLGLLLFSIGLFKKVIIADYLSIYVGIGFDNATALNFIEAWMTALFYTFQIYFDFSGYCDMAMGVAKMFNIDLPVNFNSPYKAKNISEFWSRWHMTLSRFLKDYLYIPLGGNKKGKSRMYINLFIVFLVSGFWHGAGWTFVIWGILHGLAILTHKIWSTNNKTLWKYIALWWHDIINLIDINFLLFIKNNVITPVKNIFTAFNQSYKRI